MTRAASVPWCSLIALLCCLDWCCDVQWVVWAGVAPSLHKSVVVLLTEQSPVQVHKTFLFRRHLQQQAAAGRNNLPVVLPLHELEQQVLGRVGLNGTFPQNPTGFWGVLAAIPHIADAYPKARWFLFMKPTTALNVTSMASLLKKEYRKANKQRNKSRNKARKRYEKKQKKKKKRKKQRGTGMGGETMSEVEDAFYPTEHDWLGRAVWDIKGTRAWVHEFQEFDHDRVYMNSDAGWVWSGELMREIARRYKRDLSLLDQHEVLFTHNNYKFGYQFTSRLVKKFHMRFRSLNRRFCSPFIGARAPMEYEPLFRYDRERCPVGWGNPFYLHVPASMEVWRRSYLVDRSYDQLVSMSSLGEDWVTGVWSESDDPALTSRGYLSYTTRDWKGYQRHKHSTPYKAKKPVWCATRAHGLSSLQNPHRVVPLRMGNIRFAVKTCEKYHNTRVKEFVKRTWTRFAERAEHVVYYSNSEDPSVPTVRVDAPNTRNGHGLKLFLLLHDMWRRFAQDQSVWWFAIVDDDTVLYPPELLVQLQAYNPQEAYHIGMKWGRKYIYTNDVQAGRNLHFMQDRYDFLGFGAGGFISRGAMKKLMTQLYRFPHMKNTEGRCFRPSPDDLDDVWVGRCLGDLGVPIVHMEGAHTLWPDKYTVEQLSVDSAVSFHGGAARLDKDNWPQQLDSALNVYQFMQSRHRHRRLHGFH